MCTHFLLSCEAGTLRSILASNQQGWASYAEPTGTLPQLPGDFCYSPTRFLALFCFLGTFLLFRNSREKGQEHDMSQSLTTLEGKKDRENEVQLSVIQSSGRGWWRGNRVARPQPQLSLRQDHKGRLLRRDQRETWVNTCRDMEWGSCCKQKQSLTNGIVFGGVESPK